MTPGAPSRKRARWRSSAGEAGRALLAQQEGNLGLLAREAGDDAAAEAAYRRAAELAEAAGDDEVFVTWENNLARALSRRRRYQAGWQHFSRALERARALGDDVRAADVAIDWARSLGAAHRFAEAARVQLACAEAVTAPRARAELLESALFHLSSAEDWRTVVTTGRRCCSLCCRSMTRRASAPIRSHSRWTRRRRNCAPANRHHTGTEAATRPHLDGYLVAAMAHYEETADADGMLEMARLICDIAIGLADPSEQGWRELMGIRRASRSSPML